jgi:hypothetical protein
MRTLCAMFVATCLMCAARAALAQDVLDDIDRKLAYASSDGAWVVDLSLMSDVTFYAQDAPAQGLLFSDNDEYVAPRVAAFLDVGYHEWLVLHAQVAADRGFDPGEASGGDARIDELFVDAHLTDAGRLSLRVGKFASSFGGWIARHLAWDNPMITAPLIYEDVLPMTDRTAPLNDAAFASRRNTVDKQRDWVPIVWGPSYTSGASLSGSTDTVDATVEVKNAALSSRPETWDVFAGGYETDPSVTGRLRWHPSEAWWFGGSASRGAYLQDDAKPTLPVGKHIDDYDQTTFGVDASYEHRRLQLWAELVHAKFDTPVVGDVAALSGFIEARYKATAQVWVGARWNQSWFDDAPSADASWNRDMRRLDLALGYRHTAHLEVKAQYSLSDQAGREIDGEHLFAAQFVLWL